MRKKTSSQKFYCSWNGWGNKLKHKMVIGYAYQYIENDQLNRRLTIL
jgi:hypothetical protein